LRLQSDERLVALIRRGHHGAFEALVQRYQPRLLAFCRHMLGSQEDAEDVLQEVFAASFNAICADDRPINARPWLYRIARNRCLNHLRRPQPAGQDSMDVFERDGGISTADTVHRREEFRHIVSDVGELPESQRTALLLREIDALSYDQIAESMDTTVPSVKSLLVRARVALAEASEARLLSCEEVRLELGQVAEGLTRSSPPVRRHLKACDRCRTFKGELRTTTKALAAVYPVAPFIFLKKFWVAKLGITAGGAVSAGVGTLATKAAAGMAAAVIVTAGAVEVKHATGGRVAPSTPPVVAHAPAAPAAAPAKPAAKAAKAPDKPEPAPAKTEPKPEPVAAAPTPVPVPPPAPAPAPEPAPAPAPVQEETSTVVLPPREEVEEPPPAEPAPGEPLEPVPPPGEVIITVPEPPPAPPAGEPAAPPAQPPLPAPPAP
jgi:RNA polymerase sigma factor (sigma-70 family)